MWISPVRDLAAKDLAMVTHFCQLRTVPKVEIPQYGSQASINTLAEHFIASLSVNMPSTIYAVLGTACKLVVCFGTLLWGKTSHACGIPQAEL